MRGLAQAHKLYSGDSAEFFDDLAVTVDAIDTRSIPYSADITISFMDAASVQGTITHSGVKASEQFYFGDFVVQIKDIGLVWADVEVMPLIRWLVTPAP